MSSSTYIFYAGALLTVLVFGIVSIALYAGPQDTPSGTTGSTGATGATGIGTVCLPDTKKGYYFNDDLVSYGFSPNVTSQLGLCMSDLIFFDPLNNYASFSSFDGHNRLYIGMESLSASPPYPSVIKMNPDGPVTSYTAFLNYVSLTDTAPETYAIYVLNDGTPICVLNNDIVVLDKFSSNTNYAQNLAHVNSIPSVSNSNLMLIADDMYFCVAFNDIVFYYTIGNYSAPSFNVPSNRARLYCYLDNNHDLWSLNNPSTIINVINCVHLQTPTSAISIVKPITTTQYVSMIKTDSGKIYATYQDSPGVWSINELSISFPDIINTPVHTISYPNLFYVTTCSSGNNIFICSDTTTTSGTSYTLNRIDVFDTVTNTVVKTTLYSLSYLKLRIPVCLDSERITFANQNFWYLINTTDFSVGGPFNIPNNIFCPTEGIYNKKLYPAAYS